MTSAIFLLTFWSNSKLYTEDYRDKGWIGEADRGAFVWSGLCGAGQQPYGGRPGDADDDGGADKGEYQREHTPDERGCTTPRLLAGGAVS